jgi:hypothetical protein
MKAVSKLSLNLVAVSLPVKNRNTSIGRSSSLSLNLGCRKKQPTTNGIRVSDLVIVPSRSRTTRFFGHGTVVTLFRFVVPEAEEFIIKRFTTVAIP